MKFKNPPDAPESILLRSLQKKFEPIRPRGLGCKGGAIDFGPTTSYNSGTSVLAFEFATGKNTKAVGNDALAFFTVRSISRHGNEPMKLCIRP